MLLDVNTLNSLQIFKVDRHPCITMKIGVSKEGMSIFGILVDKIKSIIGKKMLR